MTPGSMDNLSMAPSDYFRRQIHSCFWFERSGIAEAIESVGGDHLMFETDFPHPTCIYPDGLEYADAALEGVDAGHHRRDHGPQRGAALRHPDCLLDRPVAAARGGGMRRARGRGARAARRRARRRRARGPSCVVARRASRWRGSPGASSSAGSRARRARGVRPTRADARSWRVARPPCCRRAGSRCDLCTGAARSRPGCSTRRPDAFVVGVDVDAAAARCAARNGVRAVVGDLAAPVHLPGVVDVVTAVAPYVPTADGDSSPSTCSATNPLRARRR